MTPTLTPAEMRDMVRGFADHEKFCGHLKIRNKEGVAVPYRNSAAGQKLNRSIRKQELAGVPVRQVVLKASQVWMSSSAATEIFRRVPFFSGRRALVLADSQQHAKLVFEYYTQFLKSYADNPYGSEWKAAVHLPALVNDADQFLRWDNGSSILVGTANNVDIGRSAPYNWAHLSEAGFYRDMPALMTGLMQRIPRSPDSGVVVESTANGMGGGFYDLCQLAMDPRRDSGWAFVFFAWWEHPEYRIPFANDGEKARFQASLTREERTEQEAYRLTLEQLQWRRWAIDSNCEGKSERFRQEFPSNPQEAFLTSGHAIFDLAAIARMPVIQNPVRGRLEVVEVGIEKRVQFLQSEDARGELAIYSMPTVGRNYVIGADHAWGRDLGAKSGSSDPDYSSATVLDVETGEEVAKMKERYEPFPWSTRLYWLARFYRWAFICPEAQAVGKAVISHLMELNYPLELLYNRQREADDRSSPPLHMLGFDTNLMSRPRLISNLDQALRYGLIKVHDRETCQQLNQFVRKPTGREEGIGHDDDVFGLALAVEGIAPARRAFAYRAERAAQGEKQWAMSNYRKGQKQSDDDD